MLDFGWRTTGREEVGGDRLQTVPRLSLTRTKESQDSEDRTDGRTGRQTSTPILARVVTPSPSFLGETK